MSRFEITYFAVKQSCQAWLYIRGIQSGVVGLLQPCCRILLQNPATAFSATPPEVLQDSLLQACCSSVLQLVRWAPTTAITQLMGMSCNRLQLQQVAQMGAFTVTAVAEEFSGLQQSPATSLQQAYNSHSEFP